MRDVTIKDLLITAAIQKDIGWMRTFFSKKEYAELQSILDKIYDKNKQTFKPNISYQRDFYDIINDIHQNRKKYSIEQGQDVEVFTGEDSIQLTLSVAASLQDVYRTNRKLYNEAWMVLKRTQELADGVTHKITPQEELTLFLMNKAGEHPNFFKDRNHRIIGKLLLDNHISDHDIIKIFNSIKYLGNVWRTALKKKKILTALKKEGLSEQEIKRINQEIKTLFKLNESPNANQLKSFIEVLETIPGLLSDKDRTRLNIGKLSSDQIAELNFFNKPIYAYASSHLNRRFTYLAKKKLPPEAFANNLNKFTKPFQDAGIDILMKLDKEPKEALTF